MSGRHADATAADGVDGNGVIGASVDRDSATTTMGRTAETAATTELSRTTDDAATAEVDLGADPFDDNLATELAARGSRRLGSRTTLTLVGLVLVVGGFLGGVLVQKYLGDDSTSRFPAGTGQGPAGRAGAGGFAGGFGGGTGGLGGTAGQSGAGQNSAGQNGAGSDAAGPGGGSNPSTTGTVKLVDGTTVYLTTSDGETVTVKTSGSTAVRIASVATLKDLPAGATVTVQGTVDADGIVTASEVTGQK